MEMKDAIFRTFCWLARQPGGSLTVRQVATILELSRIGEVDFGTTADRIGVSRSALSRIVERLVESGLVDRREQPTDRRRILLSITPQGAELAEGILLSGDEGDLAPANQRSIPMGAMNEIEVGGGPLLLTGSISFSSTPTPIESGKRRSRARS